jgi:hypothetical protein
MAQLWSPHKPQAKASINGLLKCLSRRLMRKVVFSKIQNAKHITHTPLA